MAKYKAVKRGYDGKKVLEPGQEFEFEGVPGAWMEPLDDSAKKAVEARKKAKAANAQGVQPQPQPVAKASGKGEKA